MVDQEVCILDKLERSENMQCPGEAKLTLLLICTD
jgi:hypothetical protein